MNHDFDAALQAHFDAIARRDLAAFEDHLTRSSTLYTIVQTGHAFTTPAETVAIHAQWFQSRDWTWEGEVVHKVVGRDVGMALVKYAYRANPAAALTTSWLVYVLRLEQGAWRIVHDQNTATDYPAFARANDIPI
jgi:hypothetical protein